MWWTTLAWAAALDEAAPVSAWLEEARARALVGDWVGMRIAAERAGAQDGPHLADARYLTGMALELSGDAAGAIVHYDAALAVAPSDDVAFRRAVALWRLDRCEEVWPVLDGLEAQADAGPAVTLQLSVLRGACEIASDEVRDGVGRLTAVLDGAAPTDSPVWQAEARLVLVRTAVTQAGALPFVGSDRKRRKLADLRSGLVKAARDHLAPMIRLGEPGPTAAAFVEVVGASEAFVTALQAEPRPRKVRKPEQVEAWDAARRGLREQILVLTDQLVDRGLQFVSQTGWEGPEAEALREAQARVRAAVER